MGNYNVYYTLSRIFKALPISPADKQDFPPYQDASIAKQQTIVAEWKWTAMWKIRWPVYEKHHTLNTTSLFFKITYWYPQLTDYPQLFH